MPLCVKTDGDAERREMRSVFALFWWEYTINSYAMKLDIELNFKTFIKIFD